MGLEGELWDDLIRSQYIGILGEPDVEESEIAKCSLDVETPLVGDYRMKLHAGPGLIGGGKTDKEVKFILDGDFSTAGKHNPDAVPEKLERMHRFAVCLFQGAITKELHEAMGPTPLAEYTTPPAGSPAGGLISRRGKTALAFWEKTAYNTGVLTERRWTR